MNRKIISIILGPSRRALTFPVPWRVHYPEPPLGIIKIRKAFNPNGRRILMATSNLPDKYANEPVVAIAQDLWTSYQQAVSAADAWQRIADDLLKQIKERMGDAFAITVDGEKVATNRPSSRYAEVSLCRDYPQLTEHYMTSQVKQVLNMALFASAYPDIAEKYRVRSFREVGS